MSAVLTEPGIIIEQRVVLDCVSVGTYELLLKDYEDHSAPRFTYDHGKLEIYMPSEPHEQISNLLRQIFYIAAQETRTRFRDFGSTTFRPQNVNKGVEPDSCYYLRENAVLMAKVAKINLEVHPPPDLVIEIDISSPSLDEFRIYSALRVPEIWRYFNQQVAIYRFDNGGYTQTETSTALPGVDNQTLNSFLNADQTLDQFEWLDSVRDWARSINRTNAGETN